MPYQGTWGAAGCGEMIVAPDWDRLEVGVILDHSREMEDGCTRLNFRPTNQLRCHLY